MAAGTMDVDEPPNKFRMVPVKNQSIEYIYTLVSTEKTSRYNDRMWECGILADGEGADPGDVLFIIHLTDNPTGRKSFMAMQAPAGTKTIKEVLRFNDWVWTSTEDVLAPGIHSWQLFECDTKEFTSDTMEFTTTTLDDSAP